MRKRIVAIVALAAAGSQAGHLLSYQARFGATALQVQSTGAHAYFPTLVKTSLGALALALIGSLLLIGVSRVVLGGARGRMAGGPSYLSLLAILFTTQLGCYMAQEVTEALIAGAPVDTAPNLLMWGTLGQLPVALVASTALRWLWARIQPAGELLAVIRVGLIAPPPAPVVVLSSTGEDLALLLSRSAPAALAKRGPPATSRIRAF
jgi:hypothetical protein